MSRARDIQTDVFASITATMRVFITQRDGGICQYCGKPAGKNFAVEHIIPACHGGVAAAYNLTFSCRSCNCKKMKRVWIPNNLDEITANNPEWAVKVKELACPWQREIVLMDSRDSSLSIGANQFHFEYIAKMFPGLPPTTAARILLDWAIERYQP